MNGAKPIKCSVAAVIRRRGAPEFLAVQRPPDDDHLPDAWGLPAVSLGAGELPESGLARLGREKLGVELEPVRFMGARAADRAGYQLILMDIEAELKSGEADVHAATSTSTRYVDQQWTNDLTMLVPAARLGSLCCQIVLDGHGISY